MISTGSSSPQVAARPSRPRGNWPSSTSKTGKPTKTKVISRAIAYHGTPHGALSLTGITPARVPFEPLVPGAFKVPNTNIYRGPEHLREDEKAFGRWAADRIEEAILFEGPESVAAVFLEPVQNSGGCFPPPAGYFERVREICDRYDVLLVSDETICAFGRIGSMFAMRRLRLCPRHHHDGQGHHLRVCPLGLMIASERIFEPFKRGTNFFPTATPGAVTRSPRRPRWPTWTSSNARDSTPTSRRTPQPSGIPWSACSTCRSSATSAALATSTASRWSGQDHPRDLRRRGVRTAAARLPLQGPLRRRPLLPRRRPRRPRHPARSPLTIGQAEFDDIESRLRGVLTEALNHI